MEGNRFVDVIALRSAIVRRLSKRGMNLATGFGILENLASAVAEAEAISALKWMPVALRGDGGDDCPDANRVTHRWRRHDAHPDEYLSKASALPKTSLVSVAKLEGRLLHGAAGQLVWAGNNGMKR
jgi:hypothetical protein